MAGSDIRVKLTAEGVEDVVRALGRVQKQAKTTGAESAKGIGSLTSAFGGLQRLLPAIGIAGVTASLANLARQAIDTGDKIGKLSAKTGVSAQALSVLNVAGKTADVTFEQISGALVKFNKGMGDLDRGSKEAGEAVRLLLGNSKALEGLNTEQRLLKVTDAIGRMESGYKKTRAAQDFFGKSGADLIPLMNDLADGGFEKAAEKARKLGLIIDQDLAEAAQRANDNMEDLRLAAEGAATQFTAGLAPAVADASKALLEATTGEGVNGIRKVGEIVGSVLKGIASAFIVAGKAVGAWFEFIVEGFDDLIERFKIAGQIFTTAPSNWGAVFEKANQQVKKAAENRKAIFEYFKEDVLSSLDALWNPQASAGGGKEAAEAAAALAAEKAREQAKKINAALISAERQRIQAVLQVQKAENSLLLTETEALYKDQIIGLEDYWDAREQVTLRGIDQEVAALQAQKANLKRTVLDPDDAGAAIRLRSEISNIDQQINTTLLERKKIQTELDQGRAEARERLAEQELRVNQQILEAQGKTYQAQLVAIRSQVDELRKAGVNPGLIEELNLLMTRQAEFTRLQKQADQEMAGVGAIQDSIDLEVMAGRLFPFEAVKQYNAAILELILSLEAKAKELRAAAITDTDIEKAEQFRLEVDRLKVSVDESAQQMRQFKEGLEGALRSNLSQFFSSGIDEAENFGDAVRMVLQSVAESVRQIAADMLAQYATEQILELFGAGGGPDPAKAAAAGTAQAAPLMAAGTLMTTAGGALGAGAAAVSASAASLMAAAQMLMVANSTSAGFASGGLVSGPGTGTSDSIAARLSNGEFVVRAAAVRQPGVLEHLTALNEGMGRPVVRGSRQVPRYAEGGLVRTEDAAAQAGIVVGLEEGVIVRKVLGALKTKEAQRIQIENLGHNQKRARNALGR